MWVVGCYDIMLGGRKDIDWAMKTSLKRTGPGTAFDMMARHVDSPIGRRAFGAAAAIFRNFPTPGDWGGHNTRLFLQGVSSVGLFFLIARALTMGAQILAGRWLGPANFGLANLVLAGSNVLFIALQLGFSAAAVKFASMESFQTKQACVLSTNLWLSLLWAIPCVALCGFYHERLATSLGLPGALYVWCVGLAFCYSLRTNVCCFLQGVKLFAQRGIVELVYGLLMLLFVVVLFLMFGSNPLTVISSYILAYLGSAAWSLYALRKWIRPVIDIGAARDIRSYTLAPTLNNIAGALIGAAAPIILARQLGTKEAGIYVVYNSGSIVVASVFSGMIATVLAPLASVPETQNPAWRKLLKISIPIFLGGAAAFVLSTWLMLKCVGRGYPVVPAWILLFAGSAGLSLIAGSALTLLYSRDVTGLRLGVIGNILIGLTNLFGTLWAVRRFAFIGAGFAILASYLIGTAWCLTWGWYFTHCKKEA
jgi:O-antigen/teichoic acid export membrane protein